MSRGDSDDRDRDDRDDRRDDDRDRPRRGDRDDGPDDLMTVAKRKVKPVAICLIIIGVLYLAGCIWAGVASLVFFDQQWDEAMAQQQARPQGDPQAAQDMMKNLKPVVQVVTVALAAVFGLLAVVVIFGATRMLNLSSRGWGLAAAIIAILPLNCYVWVFGIAFGVWGLVVLSNKQVKRAFAARHSASVDEFYDRGDRDRDDRR